MGPGSHRKGPRLLTGLATGEASKQHHGVKSERSSLKHQALNKQDGEFQASLRQKAKYSEIKNKKE